MKPKKRSPKPITLLTRIERLLSDAISGLSLIEASVEKNARELLATAETSVVRAKALIAKNIGVAASGGGRQRRAARGRSRVRARRVAVHRAR